MIESGSRSDSGVTGGAHCTSCGGHNFTGGIGSGVAVDVMKALHGLTPESLDAAGEDPVDALIFIDHGVETDRATGLADGAHEFIIHVHEELNGVGEGLLVQFEHFFAVKNGINGVHLRVAILEGIFDGLAGGVENILRNSLMGDPEIFADAVQNLGAVPDALRFPGERCNLKQVFIEAQKEFDRIVDDFAVKADHFLEVKSLINRAIRGVGNIFVPIDWSVRIHGSHGSAHDIRDSEGQFVMSALILFTGIADEVDQIFRGSDRATRIEGLEQAIASLKEKADGGVHDVAIEAKHFVGVEKIFEGIDVVHARAILRIVDSIERIAPDFFHACNKGAMLVLVIGANLVHFIYRVWKRHIGAGILGNINQPIVDLVKKTKRMFNGIADDRGDCLVIEKIGHGLENSLLSSIRCSPAKCGDYSKLY